MPPAPKPIDNPAPMGWDTRTHNRPPESHTLRNKSPFIVFVIVVVAVSALLPGVAAAAGTGAADAAGDQPDQPEVANSALLVYVGVGIAMLPISLVQKVLIGLSLPFIGVTLIILLRTRSILNKE